jgi:hypothetical protein
MPKRRDVVVEQLDKLRTDLQGLWIALTKDAKAEARKQRAWLLFAGILGAAGAMGARRVAARAWGVLTGETPPMPQAKPQPPRGKDAQPAEEEHAEAGAATRPA